ncbi:hypothetical protein RHMOL_Rhmol06G0157900 [Rhododendron molle]|uniref:Uncharacterized protein n=1 Tax=Rhododendron molle TaxID=49168 RepID=A0ACC0NE06_RHOML|nr:hypothetical protein RHMOL_Rhmol06G0157900 [Rhododendron molle]
MACLSVDSSNSGDPDFIDQRGWLFPTDPIIFSQLRTLWEKTLLGHFIDDRYFSKATIQQVVNSFWHTKGPVFVEKRSGVFCFHFKDLYDIECILAEQPWNVHGAVPVLQPWAPNTILPQLHFPAMDVWVQAHNIPIECYYSNLAHLLGSAAGHLLQVDWSNIRTRSLDFFRFKVRIHTDEPLIPGAFIELLEGDFHWISFRYERIFRVCYKCGRIGHSNNACNSSLVEALDSLHRRYNESPFSSTLPLILENNKPMFSPALRALRNTDCNRTSRIWVLYEEEVQNMEMDQNLVFNVTSTDSHSSDEIYHTPEGDPTPPPVQSMEEPTPPPVQGSFSWWQSAISMFSPHPPPSHNSTHYNSSAHQTPTLFDQHSPYDQPTTVHADISNSLSFLPLSPPPSQHTNHHTNPAPQTLPSLNSNLTMTSLLPCMQTLQTPPPLLPLSPPPEAAPNTTSQAGLPHIFIPLKVSEVFRCSAPEFFGDDILVIPDSPAEPSHSSSKAIKQQSPNSKKRSSTSFSDADSPRGGKRSKLVQLNQRDQPPGITLLTKTSPLTVSSDCMDIDI